MQIRSHESSFANVQSLPQTLYRNPQLAFKQAVENGGLTHNSSSSNYVELYMYMYSTPQTDAFKNVLTREYLILPR